MKNISKIIKFTGVFWKYYVFMGVFVVVASILSIVTPVLMKQIVDLIVHQLGGGKSEIRPIIILLVAILGVDILYTMITAYSTWIGDILAVKLQTFLSKKFYEHLLALDIGFYDNNITGNLVNKMYRGITSITDFVNAMTNNFLPFFLTAFITIIFLAQYSITIAVLLAVLFPLYIYISHKSTLAWGKYEAEKNSYNDASQGRVSESMNGIRVVKSFAAELLELVSYLTARTHVEDLTVKQTKEWHWLDFLRRLALNVILFFILAYIVYYTYERHFTIGEMTLLLQLVQQARFPLFAMSFILGQIQRADAGSKDFFEILETPVRVVDAPKAKTLIIPAKAVSTPFISFDHVSFSYEEGREVLKDVTFAIKRGQKLALVGESGQGKSTIVNLLLRYYTPQKGTIAVSGSDIAYVTQASLRTQVAVVFQESLLFSGSILENIRYGSPDATEEEVQKAAIAANAYEFIETLPDGLHSLIGERGVKLSGGQKQRIAIARAMLKDAPIIVMDEATSSLDSRSEVLVSRGLEKLMENRTSIIIAHRLSTIADADVVLVVADGKIAEYGSPKELLKNSSGRYSKMVSLQQKLMTATAEERTAALAEFDIVG